MLSRRAFLRALCAAPAAAALVRCCLPKTPAHVRAQAAMLANVTSTPYLTSNTQWYLAERPRTRSGWYAITGEITDLP